MRRRAKGFPEPRIITGKRIKGCAAFRGGTPFAFVEYLERQRDRGKAQYLADAILCYEKAGTRSFQQTDRALIEQILKKQSMRRTPDLQKEEPSISSPPIDLIASALADFRG